MIPTPPGSAPNPVTLLTLRCQSCAAPLDSSGTEEIVTCRYCGTAQKLVDARAFLDQIMLQVNAFLRQALPVGIEALAAGAIDPVARHSVFVTGVRPRLTTEYGEFRFRTFNLLSNTLAILPWFTEEGIAVLNTPKDVFFFQAKAQSVVPLAVDEESKHLVAEVSGLSMAYGCLLNNVSLMGGLKPERYHLMARNFEAAADALKGIQKFAGLADRMSGLARLSGGVDHLMTGHVAEAQTSLNDAKAMLEKAKAATMQNFDLAIMLQAIDRELSISRAAAHMADALANDPEGKPEMTLLRLRRLLEMLSVFRGTSITRWQGSFRNPERYEQILKAVASIRRAQRGEPSLRLVPGSGTVAFPFWAVDIPYTFQTGALWKTHGVEVTEAMLVSATFPLDPGALSGTEPSRVLTDVFRARERGGFLSDAFKSMSGAETAISGGGPVRDVIQRAQLAPVAGMAVVPPISTASEVPLLVQDYLQQARQMDQKLRLSSPRVLGLVFVPGTPAGGRPNVMPWLGGLSPQSAGDIDALAAIAL